MPVRLLIGRDGRTPDGNQAPETLPPSDIRMWEYQNEQRSYIGFRCVRTQIGFARGQKSRK